MKSKRLIHFGSHGCGGLRFECYRAAWRGHSDSLRTVRDGNVTRMFYDRPKPLRTTDIRDVTCPNCLNELRLIIESKTK